VLVGQSSLLLSALTGLLKETDFHVLATSNEVEGVHIPDVQPFDGIVLIIQGRQVESALRQIQSFRTMYEHGRIAVLLDVDALRWEDTRPFFEAGAHACFPESVAPEVFIKSLELIMLGESFVSAALPLERRTPQRAASAEAVPVQLSPQEERILKNIADGDPNKVIARALGIADATVKVHVKNVLRKLGVGNRTQAAVWATRHGLAHRPRPTIVAVDGKTVAADTSLADDHQE
jgi:two-component system nitrate/nitrite response regulator NarL